jgi:hypothetical protein
MASILKRGWERLGDEWLDKDLPKHFTSEGAAEYGYLSRSSRYEASKFKRKGHKLPLVYSGDLRGKSKVANIVATSEGVKIRLTWANKANLRNPLSKIDMAKELRAVSDGEIRDQADLLERTVRTALQNIKDSANAPGISVAGYFHSE